MLLTVSSLTGVLKCSFISGGRSSHGLLLGSYFVELGSGFSVHEHEGAIHFKLVCQMIIFSYI